MKYRELFRSARVTSAVALCVVSSSSARAAADEAEVDSKRAPQSNVVVRWNAAALQGVRDSSLGAPMVARALAIVHTCMFDAWAAYDATAEGTQLGAALRRPRWEHTKRNKKEAVSLAAYRALVDLLPIDKATVYDPLLSELGYSPDDLSTDVTTPAGIGNVACATVLQTRHHDGSNQLGDLHPGAYSDYTGYRPLNPPSAVPVNPATIVDVNHWQPLQYFNASGQWVTQTCVAPFWGLVQPFSLQADNEFMSAMKQWGPLRYPSLAFVGQAEELIDFSAALTDRKKMIAEYWANGPHSELPPGHWDLFAEFVSARDHHGLDEDVKMFFALTNAVFDAGIAAWGVKGTVDSVRPVTAIPFLFQGQTIRSWGGPFKGTVLIDGAKWIPYQSSTFPTPPFGEFVSGHSAFSAAGAAILRFWTGSDDFGDSVTFSAGSSTNEPGATPASPVTLSWATFTEAADEAGISRRYGGIHFKSGDLAGRTLGALVAKKAWSKAREYFGTETHGGDD